MSVESHTENAEMSALVAPSHAAAFATAGITATACPSCGLELPLPRAVLAARLRCPEATCGARLKIRGGRALTA